MELKPYQKKVLTDLEEYLEYIKKYDHFGKAFNTFWENKIGAYNPITGEGMELYKNNVPKSPNVCIKVPTAGGKTFIACNAVKSIFDNFNITQSKTVVWLVPWNSILEQTIKNLSNPNHPYRQKLNTHFSGKVAIYTKDELLQGANFSPSSISNQLNIFVLSFDTLRSKKKEDRKIYQENSNLAPFSNNNNNNNLNLDGIDETALINVIRTLNPLVIVDESHNAESNLSLEMLQNLNPSFILDLTATPKKNSNIISFVNAIELKKENMVKLPVIVYNHHTKSEVLSSALQLQKKLEHLAIQEEKKTGKYIRPIILFQAQPKTNKDNTTFEKLKEKLIELNIPEEQIKIKTAEIDELKNIDLLSKKCPVRYIITVNALKEGWDCPFAYILASLADKNSVVDVEQILGRVLRQPYTQKHNESLLNLSYVLTASSKFMETLSKIVEGLNKAGFSDKDYKIAENLEENNKKVIQENIFSLIDNQKYNEEETKIDLSQDLQKSETTSYLSTNKDMTLKVMDNLEYDDFSDITSENVSFNITENEINNNPIIKEIEETAIKQNKAYEEKIINTETDSLIESLGDKVKQIKAKDIFINHAKDIILPQFYIDIPNLGIFGNEKDTLLSKEDLLKDFKISKGNTDINFEDVSADMYKVDLEESSDDNYKPSFTKLDNKVSTYMLDYILSKPQDKQIKDLSNTIGSILSKKFNFISDTELSKYLKRILEDLSSEQINDLIHNQEPYRNKIMLKISKISEEYSEKIFYDWLDIDKVKIKDSYNLPTTQLLGDLHDYGISKALFSKEHKMNEFEKRVINDIANLDNIMFWWKNTDKSGFKINAFKNHYPDFIVVTKSKKVLIVESKGDDRDNSDSAWKLKLGRAWANKAGSNYKYFMVFDKNKIEGAYTLNDALSLIKEIN
ncbi:MAG: DEAD/DEAH box helicase family protein [Candidatus Sericytochromatia bacterium]